MNVVGKKQCKLTQINSYIKYGVWEAGTPPYFYKCLSVCFKNISCLCLDSFVCLSGPFIGTFYRDFLSGLFIGTFYRDFFTN